MIRASIYLLSFLILLASCRKTGTESNILETEAKIEPVDFDLEKIIERGSIIGIVENSTTGYFVYKGQILGYEYELLKSFADYLGVELELKVTSNLQEAVEMMERGGGDIMAYPLTVTKERRKRVLFTDYHYTIRMMLIQRYPDNWRELKAHEIENSLLRNQVNLIGEEVHVRYRSSYIQRLSNLSEEIGGDITIVETDDNIETEDLIRQVSNGEIEYTVADEHIALVNATYYQNIDVQTPVSFPTQIAWALRSNAPELRDTINTWLRKIKREPTFNVIYNKYFKNNKAALSRKRSDFLSVGGGSISEYDSLIKQGAAELSWDWRLLASQIYQESKFDPKAKSWAGAMGLMQLVPITAREYGARDPFNPTQNIHAGVKYLQWLHSYWEPRLERQDDLKQFILASYNVGLGHVLDARNLTTKYKGDPEIWSGNVEKYLQLKSKPKYYDDPVVKSGYCRGDEPINYVRDIYARYNQYIQVFPADDAEIESDSVSTTL